MLDVFRVLWHAFSIHIEVSYLFYILHSAANKICFSISVTIPVTYGKV